MTEVSKVRFRNQKDRWSSFIHLYLGNFEFKILNKFKMVEKTWIKHGWKTSQANMCTDQ